MKGIRRQLAQPVELTCRQISVALLQDATTAIQRLGAPDDPEALHDYRVAVRRLRSFIGAFRHHFPKAIGKKARKKLGRLISLTNQGRDIEVQLAWLDTQLPKASLPKLVRRGYEIAHWRLSTGGQRKGADMISSVRNAFAEVSAKLETRLTDPRQSVRVDENGHMLTFADAAGLALIGHASDLRSELAAIHSVDDRPQCHRARLAAKRLRYVLEPVRGLVAGGRPVVTKLKELQDILGDLRDEQNLERRIAGMVEEVAVESSRDMVATARSGQSVAEVRRNRETFDDCSALAAALAQVRREERRLFRSLEKRWLSSAADRFFDKVDSVVRQLAPGVALHQEATGMDASGESTIANSARANGS